MSLFRTFDRRDFPWLLMIAEFQVVITTHRAFITGVSDDVATTLTRIYYRPPLSTSPAFSSSFLVTDLSCYSSVYKKWAVNIAWLVLLWLAFIFTAARYEELSWHLAKVTLLILFSSTFLMFIAAAHDEEFGPTPKSILEERESKKIVPGSKEDDQTPIFALASAPDSVQLAPSNQHLLGSERR